MNHFHVFFRRTNFTTGAVLAIKYVPHLADVRFLQYRFRATRPWAGFVFSMRL